jgi:Holliday junction resolvasome RuvABC endonuclease subunit
MIYIGIDPSLNSTGVCVNINGKTKYYLITSKSTKKMQNFSNKYVEVFIFEKFDTNKKNNEYSVVEKNKAYNIYNVCLKIQEIIKKYKKKDTCAVYMEGVSYGSLGSAALVDLSGLNFAIRNILIMNNIDFTVVTPSQNKKFATGLGNADKEHMVFSWLSIEKHLAEIKDIKIDDLADAYFLSNFYKEKSD